MELQGAQSQEELSSLMGYIAAQMAQHSTFQSGSCGKSYQGSMTGSTDATSYNGGCTDGYDCDGSNGSSLENNSEGSGQEAEQGFRRRRQLPPGIMVPPGLEQEAPPMLEPMKIQLGVDFPSDRSNQTSNSVQLQQSTEQLKAALAHWENCLQGAAPPPGMLPAGVMAPAVKPLPQCAMPNLSGMPDFSALANNSDAALPDSVGLLQEVLCQVPNTLPAAEATAVCGALADSLATVLIRQKAPKAPPLRDHTQEMQALLFLQNMDRQQKQVVQQGPPQVSAAMLEQAYGIANQHAQHAAMAAQQTQSQPTLDIAHCIATHAAQQAAASWQQQQQNESGATWEQEIAQGLCGQKQQQALETAMHLEHRRLAGFAPFAVGSLPPVHESRQANFRNPASSPPIPQHLLADSLPLSRHMPSAYGQGQMQQHHNQQNQQQYSGGPMRYVPGVINNGVSHNKGSNQGKGQGGAQGKPTGGKNNKNGKGAAQVSATKGGGKNGGQSKAAGKGKKEVVQIQPQPLPVGLEPPNMEDKSLRLNLEDLHNVDNNRILLTRKTNRLGFDSAQALEEHFSKYGKVYRVLVAHCHAKSRSLHYRPSGLGFVVMTTAEEVQAILAQGTEHSVSPGGGQENVTIHVRAFRARAELEEDLEEGASKDRIPVKTPEFESL